MMVDFVNNKGRLEVIEDGQKPVTLDEWHRAVILMNAKYHQANVKIDALIKEIIDARKDIKENERDNLINHWLFCGGLVILSLIVIFK